jgi:hypothetical protein
MPFFLSVLEDMAIAPVALFALRDPLEVAFSLRRRNGFSISKSVALWLRHVLEAEFHSRGMPRCIIFYESLLKNWRLEMSRAGKKTGVVWPAALETSAGSVEDFLTMDLYHEKNESKGLEKHPDLLFLATETYRLLRAISKAEADPDLFAKIDAVHAKFNEASDFFGAILRAEEFATQQLRSELIQKSSELERQRVSTDQQNVRQQELVHENNLKEIERLEYVTQLDKLSGQLLDQQNLHQQELARQNHQKEIERLENVAQLGKLNSQLLDQQDVHQQELARQNHQQEIERLEFVAQLGALTGQLEDLRDTSGKNESRLNLVIAELSAGLDQERHEHERLVTDLESSKNELDGLRSALAASRDLSARLTGDHEALSERHKELRADVLSKEAIIDHINREIAAQKSKVENLFKLLVERGKKNRVMLAERDIQNRAIQAQIDAFYLSRSWRMTGPFRAVRRFFSTGNIFR